MPDEQKGESLESKIDNSIKSVNERLAANFKRKQNDLRELQDSQKLIKEEILKHHEELKDLLEKLPERLANQAHEPSNTKPS